ncbi:MAG: alpha-L-glutamate ligase-like protein [Deltaproteobacteria bacterium]|nr:alpha-L-glutamate ligase-like protein [Deltaproteobacteria bacterium]
MIGPLARLARAGILGINQRNVGYMLRLNPRARYPLVDNKLLTKELCLEGGIPVPKLVAKAEHHFELPEFFEALSRRETFALKPVRGAMGNGIVVVVGRDGDGWVRAGGRHLSAADLSYHTESVLAGLYALGGDHDFVMAEELLKVHPALAEVSIHGVPDVRVIVYRGFPVMSMVRLPTAASGGRANLHQGAVGAGIHLSRGETVNAVHLGARAQRHPDTDCPLIGLAIPAFESVLSIAVAATDRTGLGYVGADVVVDREQGPVILELNARPGLAIQISNSAGLLPRLDAIDEVARGRAEPQAVEERIAIARSLSLSWD